MKLNSTEGDGDGMQPWWIHIYGCQQVCRKGSKSLQQSPNMWNWAAKRFHGIVLVNNITLSLYKKNMALFHLTSVSRECEPLLNGITLPLK